MLLAALTASSGAVKQPGGLAPLLLPVAGWLAIIVFASLTVAVSVRGIHWARAGKKPMTRACRTATALAACPAFGLLTVLSNVAWVFFALIAAGFAAGLLWTSTLKPKPWKALKAAGYAALETLMWLRDLLLRRQAENPADTAGQDVARRHERRTDAPAPALPDADGPVLTGPAFEPGVGIPPDHAVVQQRIASFEPDGLAAFIHFLTSEAKGLAGYVDAYGTCMDGLIAGPGVPPEALKAAFDFADMFAESAAMVNLAARRVLDYFSGHLEWAESHDPTKDGHWTIRE